jgi:hypothetical protein
MAVFNEDETRMISAGAVRARRAAHGTRPATAPSGLTIEICAGGAIDAEAMCETKIAWSRVWHRTGWRRPRLLKRYDAVVLVTARGTDVDQMSAEAARIAARRASLWMAHPLALTTAIAAGDAVAHELFSAVAQIAVKRRLPGSGNNQDYRRGDPTRGRAEARKDQ